MSAAGSFTQRVVAELVAYPPRTACCRAAFAEGMRLACGPAMSTSRLVAARAVLGVFHEAAIEAHVRRVLSPRQTRYAVEAERMPDGASGRPCCARSRLRAAFICAGRVNRPDAVTHLEIDAADAPAAGILAADFRRFEIPVVPVVRRNRPLLEIRSGDGVAAFLSTIGAHAGRLAFEEGRVVHEVRGDVNRRLNAETANLRRTVGAGLAQMEAIGRLRDGGRWDALPAALREAGELRERHPSDPLEVLAHQAGCSRSAMAGRLHRLVAMAAEG